MRKLLLIGGLVLVAVAVLYAVRFWPTVHWWEHYTGSDNGSGPWYLWVSGAGGVILPPILTVGGVALVAWWHHTCHRVDCIHWARFTDKQTGAKLCRTHIAAPPDHSKLPHHPDRVGTETR